MTRIELNGTPCDVEAGTTIGRLLERRTGSTRGSAVAVDGEIVPRGRWAETTLTDGQRVELITATQGG